MTNCSIGWRFPPTGGGKADGWNDPGIAHFGGSPEVSLARETIQNSLDARVDEEEPVIVEFEIRELDAEVFGSSVLSSVVDACLKEAVDDSTAMTSLREAKQVLGRSRMTCLRVADRNTTGLRDGQWRALVKMQGTSVKEDLGAGGSHGIGKFAPFAASPIRTVLYWSRFEQNAEIKERFQGKAVLMSHMSNEEERQGTGFYGVVEDCRDISGDEIPASIRAPEERTGSGTSLWLAGFRRRKGWQNRVAHSVTTNFFGAIEDESLAVMLEPQSEEIDDEWQIEISRSSIVRWFDYLSSSNLGMDDRKGELNIARLCWELLRVEPTKVWEDSTLGQCRLWVRVGEGLPRNVALMRKSGMLITTRQRGLISFRGLRDFVAICRFEGEKGNELLRRM